MRHECSGIQQKSRNISWDDTAMILARKDGSSYRSSEDRKQSRIQVETLIGLGDCLEMLDQKKE